jgi:ABC-type histidine transport system ATPase subunit
MNRHIIIGFKKGASFKTDLGDVIGIAGSRKEAKVKALKAMNVKDSKVVYCTIYNGKVPVAKVGCGAVKPVAVTIADAKVKEAKAKADKKK